MYSLKKNSLGETIIIKDNYNGSTTSFEVNPDNTDYANFKKEVLAGAELQTAEGQVMS